MACLYLTYTKEVDAHQYTQTYKNNHTTSTKCQYHIANSKPKWCFIPKWPFHNLNKQYVKKHVPIITWKPWNPVATKKIVPYTESDILKLASVYSKAW